jgi:hypothetical protein
VGALSHVRTGISFTIAVGPRQRIHSRVRVPWDHDHIFLSQIRDSANLEGQAPLFISSRNRVTQLYPQALGSLFVASYDSQGYGGGIRPLLHAETEILKAKVKITLPLTVCRYSFGLGSKPLEVHDHRFFCN